MKNVFSSPKVKTFKKQIQLVTTWVLPPFQTIQSHGGIPSFPARRAAPGRQALLLVLVPHQDPPTCTHPGSLATWSVLSRSVTVTVSQVTSSLPCWLWVPAHPEVSSKSHSWVLFPENALRSSLTVYRPFHTEAQRSCLFSLGAFRGLHPSKLFILFSLSP